MSQTQCTVAQKCNNVVHLEHRPAYYGLILELHWLRCTVVERRSLAGELSLTHARLAADGWNRMCATAYGWRHLVKATEVAENNGSLRPGGWLTACTRGSAPSPSLGNEYGKTLPFYHWFDLSSISCRHFGLLYNLF